MWLNVVKKCPIFFFGFWFLKSHILLKFYLDKLFWEREALNIKYKNGKYFNNFSSKIRMWYKKIQLFNLTFLKNVPDCPVHQELFIIHFVTHSHPQFELWLLSSYKWFIISIELDLSIWLLGVKVWKFFSLHSCFSPPLVHRHWRAD